MSAVSQVLADLERGLVIKTDNQTAMKYGTNKIPDIIYKLRKRGYVISTVNKLVRHRGVSKKVAEYRMVVG